MHRNSTRRSTSRCSATGRSSTRLDRGRQTQGPWLASSHGLDADVWELYNVEEDWTQSHDLADEYPDKLADLQRLFLIQAARFKVLPMDTRSAERFNDELVGRPTLIQGTSQTFYPGMKRLSENSVINVKNKSHSITAKVTVPESGANGVILVQGGAFGGWSVYTKDGYLKYTYNVLGLNEYTTTSDQPLSPGDHEVRMEFDYEGGGLGKGGTVTLYADGHSIGSGKVERTLPFMFSMDETVDVGIDVASPVSSEYGPTGNGFTGDIAWARIDIGDDDHSHLADPEHRMTIAMTKQ